MLLNVMVMSNFNLVKVVFVGGVKCFLLGNLFYDLVGNIIKSILI